MDRDGRRDRRLATESADRPSTRIPYSYGRVHRERERDGERKIDR